MHVIGEHRSRWGRALSWLASPRGTVAWLGLLTVSLLVPLPFHGPVAASALDLVHGPAFALTALVMFFGWRRFWPRSPWAAALTVWAVLSAFGGLTEILQGYTHRSPDWRDALHNAMGAAAGGLCAVGLGCGTGSRRLGLLLLGLALVVGTEVEPVAALWDQYLQRRRFPLLASFERAPELDEWSVNGGRIERVLGHATDGRWSLRVDLEPGSDPWPRITLYEPPADWSHYDDLVFDIEVAPSGSKDAESEPLYLTVKIEDVGHRIADHAGSGDDKDRFDRTLRLLPGRHQVRIPLADVAAAPQGRVDLRQVELLQLFLDHPPLPRTFYLDNVRLERGNSPK